MYQWWKPRDHVSDRDSTAVENIASNSWPHYFDASRKAELNNRSVQSPEAQQSAPLLTALPLEIRLKIWEFLFGDQDVFWIKHGADSPSLTPFFVCKQMFHEIRQVFASNITVGLDIGHARQREWRKLRPRKHSLALVPRYHMYETVRHVAWQTGNDVSSMTSTLSKIKSLKTFTWIDDPNAYLVNFSLVSTKQRSRPNNIRYKYWDRILRGAEDDTSAPRPDQLCEALHLIMHNLREYGVLRSVVKMKRWDGGWDFGMRGFQRLVEYRIPVREHPQFPGAARLMILRIDVDTFVAELRYLDKCNTVNVIAHGSPRFLRFVRYESERDKREWWR